ncbi:molybdenum cofactor biosynthesis protein MoaE [Azomonas macrocytogenes]|uniref:Molybdopterin synthase catalytic subunit n=1 Tax=Azomonas macrocytogenes TaxID=69962 RepID=A0A839T0C8_AZOMA|nr:molybdenum cofactor biosynthesis protein MoaE [Azomonas macrocytogenes]MBB3101966.1 molybdopterin synthase catalytic subunit [Azomonas macrocytogenes]
MIHLQREPLDLNALQQRLDSPDGRIGAAVTFCGTVRDDGDVVALELEHYPGMTEQAMRALVDEARQRWTLDQALLVHRVGRIELGQPIVWVGISSAHRAEAFAACEFLMDALKSRIPLWKKVHRRDGGSAWIDAKPGDRQRAARW